MQAVGYTKRPSKKVPFVPLKERTNYLALEAYNSNPVISVLNTKDNTFPVHKYYIAENPKSYRKINILLRLHMQLRMNEIRQIMPATTATVTLLRSFVTHWNLMCRFTRRLKKI